MEAQAWCEGAPQLARASGRCRPNPDPNLALALALALALSQARGAREDAVTLTLTLTLTLTWAHLDLHALLGDASAARARTSPAWRYHEIATTHMVPENRPDELATFEQSEAGFRRSLLAMLATYADRPWDAEALSW